MTQTFIAQGPAAAAISAHAALEQQYNAQQRLDALQREIVRRNDAQSPQAAYHLARQLEHIHAQVSEEQYPPQNALRLFRLNTEVPAGAETHTIRRRYQHGTAQQFGGGEVEASVRVTQDEETFPIRHYVTGLEYDIFQQMSANFANSGMIREQLRAARDVLMEYLNWKSWVGNGAGFGVMNYPWLQKAISGVDMTGGNTPKEVIAELNKWANQPYNNSKTVYKPNRVAVAPVVHQYVHDTPRSDTTDTTIAEFWTKTNSRGIKTIDEAWELDELAPEGYTAMLFWNDSSMGLQNVLTNPFSLIPLQLSGFTYTQYAYISHGGIMMINVGSNILVFVPSANR